MISNKFRLIGGVSALGVRKTGTAGRRGVDSETKKEPD